MRRSLLTSLFVFTLLASSFASACADESGPAPAAPAALRAANDAGAAAPSDAAVAPGDQSSADGLVLWNATPVAETNGGTADTPALASPALVTEKHVSRLRRFASGIINRSSLIASSLTRSAMRFIGTPYVFGGTRASGFDCSGYVQHVFALLGLHLPRTADAQYDAGSRIGTAMVPGDLVFFHTYAAGVSHVGIYLGNSKFIHSSSSHGVSIASLHDSYWAPRYLGAKRVFGQ